MKQKQIVVGLVLFTFFAASGICLAASSDKFKVRLGIAFSTAYAPFYVAKEKGFYTEAGVDVEFLMGSMWEIGPDMVQAIIGGDVDAGLGGTFGVISTVSKGAPIISVCSYGYGGNRLALAVRKDSGIKSFKDLYGKKLAVHPRSIGHQMFANMCSMEGLDPTKIEVIPLKTLDMPPAIATKGVDAMIAWEPHPTLLQEKGLVDILQRGGKYQKSYGCVFFSNSFVKQFPETIYRFTKAHYRAMQFVRQHPSEASVINSKYVRGSEPKIVEKTYSHMVFDPRITMETFESIETDVKFMLKQKMIEISVKPDQIATTQFTDKITKEFPEFVKDLK